MVGFLVKKKYLIVISVAIITVGVFLRVFNFSDWLHFELDQARDARIVNLAAEEGIGNLPLLGPKAAGSFLRLGPVFYYFEYFSAEIFGNTPDGIAVISLIFSCLTLPLFYFFVRRYFSQKISLMLLFLFSVSLFLIMYSRFAWNPNNLPFFVLAASYALLRAVDHGEKKRGWWLVAAAVALAIATQLHFIAFLALPLIAGAFLLIKHPHINWKFWLLAAAVIVFFYIPPVINDIKTGGGNISEFKKIFVKKSAKDGDKYSLTEKIIKNAGETAIGYFIIQTGYQKAELPVVKESAPFKFDIVCDKNCKKNILPGMIAALLIISGVVLFFVNFFSRKEARQRDFLIISALWFLASFALFVPIAYNLAPRFFLLVAPLAFVFFGLLLEFAEKKKILLVGYLLFLAIVASNGWMIYQRFSELAAASRESFKIESDKIIKERERVTLEQQLKIIDYIEKIYQQNKYPVYVNSEAFWRRAFLYHLEQRNIPRDDFRNTGKNVYARGNYFLIYPSDKTAEEIAHKYSDRYFIFESRDFGTLRLVRLTPKTKSVNVPEQIFEPEKKPISAPGVPVRCRWNEIFNKCNPDEIIGDEAEL